MWCDMCLVLLLCNATSLYALHGYLTEPACVCVFVDETRDWAINARWSQSDTCLCSGTHIKTSFACWKRGEKMNVKIVPLIEPVMQILLLRLATFRWLSDWFVSPLIIYLIAKIYLNAIYFMHKNRLATDQTM